MASLNFTEAVRSSKDPQQEVLRTMGENGCPSLTETGQGYSPLAYFDKLCRDLDEPIHNYHINRIIREAEAENTPTKVVELFLLWAQTRDCRGGKGDKLSSMRMIKLLYSKYPNTVINLVECLPFYGYWKDPLLLIKEVKTNPVAGVNYKPLINNLFNMMATKIMEDNIKLSNGSSELSLVAKYAPREGHEFDKKFNAVSELCKIMYPEIVGKHLVGKPTSEVQRAWKNAKGYYRKTVSKLCEVLSIPERLMCARKFAEIDFGRATSLYLNRNMNALLNETNNGEIRHPNDADRIKCADNLLSKLGDLNGKMLFPHELVKKVINSTIYNGRNLSPSAEAIVNAQWTKIRENIIEMAEKYASEAGMPATEAAEEKVIENGDIIIGKVSQIQPGIENKVYKDNSQVCKSATSFKLSSLVPMADVSGSMTGLPMEVCIALAILLSEITHESFRDLIMTFSSNPVWEDFKECNTFVQKVKKLIKMDWGMNTDFHAAIKNIEKIVEDNGISVENTPDLVVFSDMQFDTACCDQQNYPNQQYYPYQQSVNSDWDTMYEKISKMFHDLGIRMDGNPRRPPRIVFWNLRSNTLDYPVAATQGGVITMSGYNPSLMKFFLSGQLEGKKVETVDDETGEVNIVTKQITPLESFKTVMADSRLNMIRVKLAESQEGILAKFSFDDEITEETVVGSSV